MGLRDLVYEVYERRLAGRLEQIDRSRLPRHVGIILDGNRRWAKGVGKSTAGGHQAGADKIVEFLGWCEESHVEVVTLWLLSTDNLQRARGGAAAAARDHRGDRPRPGGASPLADPSGGCAGPPRPTRRLPRSRRPRRPRATCRA